MESYVDNTATDRITANIFRVMPLLKKRLTMLSAVQAEHGIPQSHVQVLAMLNETGSMSVSDISRRFGIAKPNITPLVDRLAGAGYVDRVRNNADRRVVNVVILPAGREKLNEIQTSLTEHVRGWASTMSEQEYEELSQSLESVARILGNS